MSILTILTYASPICGILSFILGAGRTVIYPWLREKFNDELRKETEKALAKNYDHVSVGKAFGQIHGFLKKYKWDWRPKIVRKKRELRKLRNNKTKQLFERIEESLKKFDINKVREMEINCSCGPICTGICEEE